MASEEVTCRIRVQKPQSVDEGTTPSEELTGLSLQDFPDVPIETREKWAHNVIAITAPESEVSDTIRPWDLLLHLDGTVSALPVPTSQNSFGIQYPARFRIPPDLILGFDQREKVRRAETFALGSVLYEIETGRKPFEGLDDSEIQRKYSAGEFPPDVSRLKYASVIYFSWSWEFGREFSRLAEIRASQPAYKTLAEKTANYAKDHPFLCGAQALGGALSIGFLAAPAALGALGFAATGPVAGSLAAAWQASMPLVQAGSLFSWLQGAGMGGSALGGLWAAAGSGAAAVGGITAMSAVFGPSEMEDIFQRSYRKGYVKAIL